MPKIKLVWLIYSDTLTSKKINWLCSAAPTRAIARSHLRKMKEVAKSNGYPMRGHIRSVCMNLV